MSAVPLPALFRGFLRLGATAYGGPAMMSRPSGWLLTASAVDIAAASFLAAHGGLMAPLSLTVVAALLGLVLAYRALLDLLKVPMFRALGFAPSYSRT